MTSGCVTVLVPRTDPDGTLRFAADLGVAAAMARWSSDETVVRLRTGVPAGVVRNWSATVTRGASTVVVLTEGLGSPGESVGSRLPGAHVVPADRVDDALRAVLPGRAPAPGPACPYALGVLSRGDVEAAGVDLRLGTAPLGFVARTGGPGAARPVLALHGLVVAGEPTTRTARGGSTASEVARARAGGWDCVAVVRAFDLTLPVAVWLRSIGVGRVRLDLSVHDADALRDSAVVATSSGIELAARIDLHRWSVPLPVAARAIAGMARVWPRTEVSSPPQLLGDLIARAALAGVRGDAAVARRARQDVRRTVRATARLVEEPYPDVPLVVGPHDVWWEHEDDPAAHAAWLAEILPVGGRVHRVAHRQVVGWDGGVVHRACPPVPSYSDIDHEDAAGFGFPRSRRCVDAFLADAELAWRTGDPPPRFLGHVGGLCQVGGPCWSAGGRRLFVDHHGSLRTRPQGPEIGAIGDGFQAVRRRARGALACCCSTPRSPWIHRVLATRGALRAHQPGTAARASGWGGPLLHGHGAAPEWPPGIALLRTSDRFVVHDTVRGTRAELDEVRALVLEIVLDLGDRAAPELTRLTGAPFTPERVARVRGSLVTRMSGRSLDQAAPVRRQS